MNASIALIGPASLVSAFRLVGVDVHAVTSVEEGIATLYECKNMTMPVDGVEKPKYAVLFASEEYLAALTPEDERRLGKGALPAIIALPSPKGSLGFARDRLNGLIERAIGSSLLT